MNLGDDIGTCNGGELGAKEGRKSEKWTRPRFIDRSTRDKRIDLRETDGQMFEGRNNSFLDGDGRGKDHAQTKERRYNYHSWKWSGKHEPGQKRKRY